MISYRSRFFSLLVCTLLLALGGCATTQQPRDYREYRSHMPRSLLVMPPINNSVDVDAPYVYLSTVTRPLAEAGYYVFPVAVVDAFMKENGLPGAAEMQAVPLEKIHQVFGADAVLYISIEDWGQKYVLISSTTVVKAHARLVDVKTGATLWEGTAQAAEGSGDGGGGLVGMLVAAAVEQVLDTATGRVHSLCRQANAQMVMSPNQGLLKGPYSPAYSSDPRGR